MQLVAKNTFVFGAMRATQYLLLFGFTVVAARQLGVRDFGTLTFALAFTALFAVGGDFGLGRLANREVARSRARMDALVGNSLSVKLGLSAMSLLLVAAAIRVLGYPASTRQVVYLLAVSTVFLSFEFFFEGVFKGVEKMEYQALSATSAHFFTAAFGVALLLAGRGLAAVACAFIVGRLAALVIALLIYARKLGTPRFAFDWAAMRGLLREAWPFAVFALLGVSYLQLDTVLLSKMKGAESVGAYQAAMRLVLVLMIVPEAISEAVFPRMARLYVTSRERLNAVYRRCLRLLWVAGLPLAVALFLLAERIVVPIYGKPYADAVFLLQIAAWVILPRFLAYVPGILLTAIDQQRERTAVAGLCVGVTVVANLLLIPRAGAAGAAAAAIVTNVTLFVAYTLFARSRGFVGVSWLEMLRPLAAAGVMGLLMRSLPGWGLAALAPGLAGYGVALYLLGGISSEDRQLLHGMFTPASRSGDGVGHE